MTTRRRPKHRERRPGGRPTTRKLVCAPGTRPAPGGSCYSQRAIHKIADAWNLRHPELPQITGTAEEKRAAIANAMAGCCEHERCWLTKAFGKAGIPRALSHHTFAPAAPRSWSDNPREWLDSHDITRVMRQYEKRYPGFAFLGPSPVDFDKRLAHGTCVWEDLCNFDLRTTVRKGKRFVGFIFNLDPHNKGGSHWISMFLNIPKGYLFAYDSTGDPMPRPVNKLIKRIVSQARAMDIDIDVKRSSRPHQRKDTECGIYAIHMIVSLLAGSAAPATFQKGPLLRDDEAWRLRAKYFNV